jgi:hypothetical protein
MGSVARHILTVQRVAAFALSIARPSRALESIVYLRPTRNHVLVSAMATLFACVTIVILTQTMPTNAHVNLLLHQNSSPAPPAYPAWNETQVENIRLASHAYIECSLTGAGQLAFEPQIPELIANAAIKRCASHKQQLRELAMLIAGEGGSLAIMDNVDELLREHARTIIIAIREEAEQQRR